jgi:Ca-activated chloride channel family protein
MVRGLLAALAAVCLLLSAPTEARAEGALVVRGPGGEVSTLPLLRTAVDADIGGSVTSVTVTQRFHNSAARPIEAVYVFPLPTDAAVDAMEMHIGRRVLRAQIDRRASARQRYEQARDQGVRAALLEQERPNIFTFNVANIDPGADVDVTLHFFGSARYDDHTYAWAFPMVVGPRYIPGTPLASPPVGTGVQRDTDRVTDASRISPDYVPPGTRSGHAVSLRVRLDAGTELEHIEAPAHDVEVSRPSPAVAEVTLRDKDEIPNRDFILRWKVAAPTLRASVLTHRPAVTGDGWLALSLEPRHDAPPTETTAREVFFLLDTSGSMQGPPLDAVKRAIDQALTGMRPDDSFQIIDFADTASSFAPAPLPATLDNVARARSHLASLAAGGGTNQLAGIHAALSAPGDPMRLRYVVFMTDGYIGNEAEVIALTRREIGNARIFSFGVGSSVNRYLLEEVALAGRGGAEFLRTEEAPEAMVSRFYERIARPYLTDVRIDWGGLAVRDAEPGLVPDVSSLSPLTVLARYDRPGTGTVTVSGMLAGRPYRQALQVTLPEVSAAHGALASLWARQRIEGLSREGHLRPDDREIEEAITGLALHHHLVSRFTSFVAIDDRPGTSQGRPVRVDQPLDAPAGVDLRAAGGATRSGSAVRESFGFGGLGLTGVGQGGSGRSRGTIGLGDVGTMGHGGYGQGAGVGGLRGRAAAVPAVRPGVPAVLGSLSPEVIRRVVLRNAGQVRRCYELSLLRNPTLAGTFSLRFVIDANGRVLNAVPAPGSTLRDAAFELCVTTAVRRWIFPVPPGGGVVTIQYPFVFAPQRP